VKELIIGPSNGWFYAQELYDVKSQIEALKNLGVEAMEVVLGSWGTEEIDRRIASLDDVVIVNKFPFLSIHAPDYSESIPPRRQVLKLAELTANHMPDAVVIHPLRVGKEYPFDYYESLVTAGIPLAIENTDKEKQSGFLLNELEEMVLELNLKFVLDVQHAYEHDSSMQYAKHLFEALGDKISHFHVSGEKLGNHHSLLCKATNFLAILTFLQWAYDQMEKPLPMILEGEYRATQDIEAEITLLRSNIPLS